ncbi:hypothetical protein P9166_14475 [Lactococcus lactis]|nr:hypothetical protein P9166_14475 [Lactococcus lactis]
MKINIFDHYNENTKKLMQSLSTAGINRKNIFVHYDGELPSGSTSPYSFFMGLNEEATTSHGLFFNQVVVPEFYDIRHRDGGSATIEFLKNSVGIIHYRKQGYRLVDMVDWFSKENSNLVIKRDYYNLSGTHYASTYYSTTGPYQTDYYNLKGQVVVSEDLVHRGIQLNYQLKVHHFENVTQFFLYFLKQSEIEASDIYINSLSFPLFISRSLNIGKKTTLFWQESIGQEIPGNMKNELEKAVTLKQIVFAEEKQLEQVSTAFPETSIKLSYLSAIGEFSRFSQYRPQAFILTNSDNIYGLRDLLINFPELQITVAAYTNMSTKLLHLEEEYTNIQLIPSINEEELRLQLEKADIYLDINRGLKVGEILKWAYQENMLIFSYKEVAQARGRSLVFEEIRDLCNHLSYILTDQSNWQKLLTRMLENNGPLSTIQDYQTVLEP